MQEIIQHFYIAANNKKFILIIILKRLSTRFIEGYKFYFLKFLKSLILYSPIHLFL